MKYYVNIPQIIQGNFPHYMQWLAKTISDKGYFSIGDFLQGLSTEDLEMLMDDLSNQEDKAQDTNMLLTCLLSIGESLDIEFCDNEADEEYWNIWADIISTRYEMLAKFTFFESLVRRGYLLPIYKNWTLDYTEKSDKIVVESLNDGVTDLIKHILSGNKDGNGLRGV